MCENHVSSEIYWFGVSLCSSTSEALLELFTSHGCFQDFHTVSSDFAGDEAKWKIAEYKIAFHCINEPALNLKGEWECEDGAENYFASIINSPISPRAKRRRKTFWKRIFHSFGFCFVGRVGGGCGWFPSRFATATRKTIKNSFQFSTPKLKRIHL